MGSKDKYLIAMEINVGKDDNSMINGNDSEEDCLTFRDRDPLK